MDTSGPVDDRVALITGANSGIGAATARRLAADGTDVVLAARRDAPLESVKDQCERAGVDALAVPTDVTDRAAVDALVEAAVDRFGHLDIAVVNAGIGEARDVPLSDLPVDQFERVTATNIHGAYYTTRAVLPALRESDGALVYVGSYKGKHPSTSTPVYAASKWWLRGFALSVSGRVGRAGAGVAVVRRSGVRRACGPDGGDQTKNSVQSASPRWDPTGVADAIAWGTEQEARVAVRDLARNRRDIFERF